jgi:hypothetical protein
MTIKITINYAALSLAGMGKIGKWKQLNEKKWHGVVQDLGFNEMRQILKFSFKPHLMNETESF